MSTSKMGTIWIQASEYLPMVDPSGQKPYALEWDQANAKTSPLPTHYSEQYCSLRRPRNP